MFFTPGGFLCGFKPLFSALDQRNQTYWRRERTPWGSWFAWASIDWDAWLRIWFFVKFIISSAMLVSRIRDSADVRFSLVTLRLSILCSSLFWRAPNLPVLQGRAYLCQDPYALTKLNFTYSAIKTNTFPDFLIKRQFVGRFGRQWGTSNMRAQYPLKVNKYKNYILPLL